MTRQLHVEHILTHGIARHHDFVLRKEAFHIVIGHANLRGLLCQELIGHAGIGVLLLYEARNAFGRTHIERGATGETTHSHSGHRLEILDDALGHTFALPYFEQHDDIFQQVFPVEAANR